MHIRGRLAPARGLRVAAVTAGRAWRAFAAVNATQIACTERRLGLHSADEHERLHWVAAADGPRLRGRFLPPPQRTRASRRAPQGRAR